MLTRKELCILRYSLQSRLAQVRKKALLVCRVFPWAKSLLCRLQGVPGTKPHNLCRFSARLLFIPELAVGNNQKLIALQPVGDAGEGALEDGDRLLVTPRRGVSKAYLLQVNVPIPRIESRRLLQQTDRFHRLPATSQRRRQVRISNRSVGVERDRSSCVSDRPVILPIGQIEPAQSRVRRRIGVIQ